MIAEMSLLLGLLAVASNPSPFFAALGLVWGAGAGCFVLVKSGLGFLSLVLFLIYLGGMMVVFAYCSALVAEPYPEAWGSHAVLYYIFLYCLVVLVGVILGGGVWDVVKYNVSHDLVLSEWWGVSELLSAGGWVLVCCGWGLLLTLFVVLEVVRGHSVGALRAV
uniref:NADH-ubiquinone oxidoreductase chain 6 n=1 Tax=Polypedates braueri TaxID=1198049 RepID=A0A4D6WNK5_POLBR|nr:NADH dehydrogenase subunit 6 [Polypedates braueri]QCI03850.1 NADH dehydrogenase subunit 6 [Polypedates braueri]UKT59901.1 NADH dehydrogenase subunit 6 [Polypedates braueri]